MNYHLIIITIGLLYVLLFGGLSLLRREGLSLQFAYEVIGMTAIFEAIVVATGFEISPIIYLVVIYLVSMRVRLLVDLASMISGRGRQRDALNLLHLALRLYPDKSSRLVVLVNLGIVQLLRQNLESAQELLTQALEESKDGGLGVKYEAACRYNLGISLLKSGKNAAAVRELNETMVIFPNSIYSKAAEKALEKYRGGDSSEKIDTTN